MCIVEDQKVEAEFPDATIENGKLKTLQLKIRVNPLNPGVKPAVQTVRDGNFCYVVK